MPTDGHGLLEAEHPAERGHRIIARQLCHGTRRFQLEIEADVIAGVGHAPVAQRLDRLHVDSGRVHAIPARRVGDRAAALGDDRRRFTIMEDDREPACGPAAGEAEAERAAKARRGISECDGDGVGEAVTGGDAGRVQVWGDRHASSSEWRGGAGCSATVPSTS